MNLNKHLEFIAPSSYNKPIHLIGVGAVGSRVAEQLARLGFTNFYIYDFDKVEDVNIPNQLYTHNDIGKEKVDAIADHIKAINPEAEFKIFREGYTIQRLKGAIFLSVDSINLRRSITESIMYNDKVDVVFDGRMRLTDAQYYGADWGKSKEREIFLNSMQFTDEDAEVATPVSVCGTTLSVVPTVVVLASLMTANFINFIKGEDVMNMILVDPFKGTMFETKY